jgi:hypothetical protein
MNMNIIISRRSKAEECILDKVWWDSTEYCSWDFIYFWENYQTLWRIYYIILQRIIQGFKNINTLTAKIDHSRFNNSFLISNFRRVLNHVYVLLGVSTASD